MPDAVPFVAVTAEAVEAAAEFEIEAAEAIPGAAQHAAGATSAARAYWELARRNFKKLLPPRAPGGAHDPAFVARFGSSKAAHMLAAVNPTPLPLAADAVETFARSLIAASASEAFPPEHFYIFDLGAVYERWRVWTTSLPRVTPYYAVKCNPDPAMLALLASLGTGFDCASPFEIELVTAMGVPPERIVYAHCCKMPRDLRHAAAVGVKLTTFDTEAELDKIAALHPSVGLVLRIRADDPAARCNLGDKYGAEEDEIEPLLRGAAARGLSVVGISFHVGSGARNPAAFPLAVAKARAAFDAAAAHGFQMRVLDLGGGYSGNLTEGITMEAVAASLNAALEAHFPAADGVQVIAEPGRYFAEPGMTLFTRVFGKRVRERGPDADCRYYWIADGVYGSMNCQVFDHAILTVRPFPTDAATSAAAATGERFKSTIYGPTCDGMDTLMRAEMLPELAVGDWMVWPSFGAYTLAAGTAFNGFDSRAVPVHYVYSGGMAGEAR